MTKTQFGVVEAAPSLPAKDLLRVPHKGGTLVVSYPAFGPSTYTDNLFAIGQRYFHSSQLLDISFRPATTAESISIVAYGFFGDRGDRVDAKRNIFDPTRLQAGWLGKTSEGVWANPPKDEQGELITDEKRLRKCLNGVRPITIGRGRLYIVPNKEIKGLRLRDFGFVDYGAFETGAQDCSTFAQGGLARLLEHARGKKPKNLRKIASHKDYERRVDVWDFNPVRKLAFRVASLFSGDCGLVVRSDAGWQAGADGHAFGVLDTSAKGSS